MLVTYYIQLVFQMKRFLWFSQTHILKSILFTLGTVNSTNNSNEKSLILQQAVCEKLFNA